MEFQGLISADGPYISCKNRSGGVALGVCGLRKFAPVDYNNRSCQHGWWLVKYDSEARLDLTDFSDSDVKDLSEAFGIALLPPHLLVAQQVRQDFFFKSRAGEALFAWVRAHPRLASQHASYEAYLPGWHSKAVASIE
ncbi:hypothetical protein D7S82_15900 [Ralstonia pickettii]|nr:hypothetical protein [Ralstonia pickettii]